MIGTPTGMNYKEYYRDLARLLRHVDQADHPEAMLTSVIDQVIEQFGVRAGISSGRLYKLNGPDWVVVRSVGSKGQDIMGLKIPVDYSIVQELTSDTVKYFAADHDGIDRELEERLGVGHFAGFYVGRENEYIAAFGIDSDFDREDVELILNSLCHAIQHRLRELELEGQLKEARSIQVSLLPAGQPVYPGYELAGRSIPAETVGGDIFDFLPIDANLLGVAIGDASGHGLPAALQARDVVTGLRMAVERDLKITAVTRRLNRVIHRSGLTSRFVSLIYGELERNGNFVYVNAGHEPAVLLKANGASELLGSTGIVMGPVPDATYRRDMVVMSPGDVILLYTDGVVERTRDDVEYGLAALEASAREVLASDLPFAQMPQRLLDATFEYGRSRPWSDDATVVMIRRGE